MDERICTNMYDYALMAYELWSQTRTRAVQSNAECHNYSYLFHSIPISNAHQRYVEHQKWKRSQQNPFLKWWKAENKYMKQNERSGNARRRERGQRIYFFQINNSNVKATEEIEAFCLEWSKKNNFIATAVDVVFSSLDTARHMQNRRQTYGPVWVWASNMNVRQRCARTAIIG